MKYTRTILLLLPLLIGGLSSCGEKKEFDDPEVEVSFKESFDDLGEKVDIEKAKELKDTFIKKQIEKTTTYRRYLSTYSKDERDLDNETTTKAQTIFRIYDDYFFVEEYSGDGVRKEKGNETKYDFSSNSYELYHVENKLYLEVNEYAVSGEVRFYTYDLSKSSEEDREATKKEVYQTAVKNLIGYMRYDSNLDFYKAKDGNGYIYIYNNVYEYVDTYSDSSKKYATLTQQYIHFNEEYELILETYYYKYYRNYSEITGEKYDDFITFNETKAYSYASYGERVIGEEKLNELINKYDKRRYENGYFNISSIKYEDGSDLKTTGYIPSYIYKDQDLNVFTLSSTWKLRKLHVGKAHTIRYDLEVFIYDRLFNTDFEEHILIPDLKVKEGQESIFSFDPESSLVTFTPTEEEQDVMFSCELSFDERGDVLVRSAMIELGE